MRFLVLRSGNDDDHDNDDGNNEKDYDKINPDKYYCIVVGNIE